MTSDANIAALLSGGGTLVLAFFVLMTQRDIQRLLRGVNYKLGKLLARAEAADAAPPMLVGPDGQAMARTYPRARTPSPAPIMDDDDDPTDKDPR